MLRFLGKLQKGRATATGVVLAMLGGLGMTEAAGDVAAWSELTGQVLATSGTALALFGFGRKAGAAAARAGDI